MKSKDEKAGEPVRVENAWPALVSRETFEAVKQGLHERAPARQRPGRVGSQYLLSGLLKCGVCGKTYSTKLDKIKNLHSTDSKATENSDTRGRSIWVHSSPVGKFASQLGVARRPR